MGIAEGVNNLVELIMFHASANQHCVYEGASGFPQQ